MASRTLDLSDETSDAALAVVEPSEKQLAVGGGRGSYESQGALGEVVNSDFDIPKLILVGKTGDRSDLFPHGSWTVGDNVVATKDESLIVSALSIQKCYQEVIPFGEGFGTIYETAAEVRAAGLSLQRNADRPAQEVAFIVFWIESPEDADETLFPIVTSEGRRGTIAKYFAKSTSYGAVAQPIFTAISPLGHLRGRHVKYGQWSLSSFLKKGENNSYWKPVFKSIKEATPADVIEIVDSLGINI